MKDLTERSEQFQLFIAAMDAIAKQRWGTAQGLNATLDRRVSSFYFQKWENKMEQLVVTVMFDELRTYGHFARQNKAVLTFLQKFTGEEYGFEPWENERDGWFGNDGIDYCIGRLAAA